MDRTDHVPASEAENTPDATQFDRRAFMRRAGLAVGGAAALASGALLTQQGSVAAHEAGNDVLGSNGRVLGHQGVPTPTGAPTTAATDVVWHGELARPFSAPQAAPPTGAGWVGFNQGETNTANRWVQDKLTDMVSIFDYEKRDEDDNIDIVETFQNMFESYPAGAVVYIPAGEYNLTGWTTPAPRTAPLTLNDPLTLVGASSESVTIIGSSQPFIKVRGNVYLDGITFKGFPSVLDFNSLEGTDPELVIKLVDCKIVEGERGLYWEIEASPPPALAPYEGSIDQLYVQGCTFQLLEAQGIYMLGNMQSVVVTDCLFKDVTSVGIFLGRDEGTFVTQDLYQRMVITSNTFQSINMAESHNINSFYAILVHGKYANISLNTITDIKSSFSPSKTIETAGIYTKCLFASIVGNVIGGFSVPPASADKFSVRAINVKGATRTGESSPRGYGVTVQGNYVNVNGLGTGIRVQNEDVLVEGNYIEEPRDSGIFVAPGSTDRKQDYHNVMIMGNTVRGLDGDQPSREDVKAGLVGINVQGTGNRVSATNNTVCFVAEGIRVYPDLDCRDRLINGNVITDCTVFGIHVGGDGGITNVAITNNQIDTIGHRDRDPIEYPNTTLPASSICSGIHVNGSGAIRNLNIQGNQITTIDPSESKGSGITFAPSGDITNLQLKANTIDNVVPVTSDKFGYGIHFQGTAASHVTIEGNDLTNIKTTVVSFVTTPSDLVVRHNRGYLPKSSGTASIPSSATSVSVLHQLSSAPAPQNIIVTPTNRLGNATTFSVQNVTATTFDIGVNVAPGISPADFVWQVL